MSNWWDIDFSVIGPELAGEQDQFTEKTMAEMRFDDGAKLFHHVKIVASVPGYRAIHASRNHSGGPAIEELITRFPKLTFNGVLPPSTVVKPSRLLDPIETALEPVRCCPMRRIAART